MVGPGDEAGAGTRGGRDQVIGALKAAFVQGRLTKDEFELRVAQALAIYAELDALTVDIPAGAQPAVRQRQEPTREAANRRMIQQATAGVGGLTFLVAAALLIPRDWVPGVIAGVLLSCIMAVLTAGFLTLLSWALDRRSSGQAEQGPPGTGGEATRQPGAAEQPGFPGIGQDPPHATQAARRRRHAAKRFQTRPAVQTS